MTILWSIVGFIVVMGLVVTIHEWGHYQVARWFNIKVKTFSIGFGKSLYERQGVETCFKIGMIPLGGYVRFVDEAEGPVAKEDLARAFNRQSVYKRFTVVAAGPLINLLFAWIVFSVMYMIGVSGLKPVFNDVVKDSPIEQSLPVEFFQNDQVWSLTQVDNENVYSWQMVHQAILKAQIHQESAVDFSIENIYTGEAAYLERISLESLDLNNPDQNWLTALGFKAFQMPLLPVLGEVVSGGPSERAGLLPKDLIVSINDKPIERWTSLVEEIKVAPNQTIPVTYQREGVVYNTIILLGQKKLPSGELVGQMGVGVEVPDDFMKPYSVVNQYEFTESLQKGYQRSVDLLKMSLVMMQRMFFGDVSLQHLSGPLSIAQFSGQAMQSGLITFLSLLGLISLSIGILNLLPIPVLDGGHLVYYLVEMVKGSPVSAQVMDVGQRIGVVLIIGLTFVALFNDVLRITHG